MIQHHDISIVTSHIKIQIIKRITNNLAITMRTYFIDAPNDVRVVK